MQNQNKKSAYRNAIIIAVIITAIMLLITTGSKKRKEIRTHKETEPTPSTNQTTTYAMEIRKTESNIEPIIDKTEKPQPQKTERPKVEGKEVCFQSQTLTGEIINSKEFFKQADLTIITVWAPRCPPCIKQLPKYTEAEIKLKEESKNIQFLGICRGASAEDKSSIVRALSHLEDAKIEYPNLACNNDIHINVLHEISNTPAVFYVDKNGQYLCEPIIGYNEQREKWYEKAMSLYEEIEKTKGDK